MEWKHPNSNRGLTKGFTCCKISLNRLNCSSSEIPFIGKICVKKIESSSNKCSSNFSAKVLIVVLNASPFLSIFPLLRIRLNKSNRVQQVWDIGIVEGALLIKCCKLVNEFCGAKPDQSIMLFSKLTIELQLFSRIALSIGSKSVRSTPLVERAFNG